MDLTETTIRAAIYTALIGVVGIFVGILLSFGLEIIRTGFRERKTRRRVRALLRLEIEDNLEQLGQIWSTIVSEQPSTTKADFEVPPQVLALIQLPLPVWSHKIWESHLPLVAASLAEHEIGQMHLLHTRLDAITTIHEKILVLNADFHIASAKPANLVDPRVFGFYNLGPALLAEIKKNVDEIKAIGNPLLAQERTERLVKELVSSAPIE